MKINALYLSNLLYVVLFSFMLYFLLFIPLTEQTSIPFRDDFNHNTADQMYNAGWWKDTATNANLTLSEGKAMVSQYGINVSGDTWLYFDTYKNVTQISSDFELRAMFRWNGTGTGSSCIGVLYDGKDLMYRLNLFGGDLQRLVLTRGYIAIHQFSEPVTPTTGWHEIGLSSHDFKFVAYYDNMEIGEYYVGPDPAGLPARTILFGTGWNSFSEFDYVEITYFKSAAIPLEKNTALLTNIFVVVLSFLVLLLLNARYNKDLLVVPITAIALYTGIVVTRLTGEGITTNTTQFIISTVLTGVVALLSIVRSRKRKHKS